MERRRRSFASRLASLTVLLLTVGNDRAWGLSEGPTGASTGDSGQPIPGLELTGDAQEETGAARTRVTVAMPSGRNGMTPNVVLSYSSVQGTTPYGVGWDLVLGKIERSTRMGVPQFTTSDTLVVTMPDSVREVVPTGAGYAARIEDQHYFVTEGGCGAGFTTNCFTVHDVDGRTYLFGGQADAVVPAGATTVLTTFAWHLTRVTDLAGNRIDITYRSGAGYPYPDRIEYGGHTSLGHAYKVKFNYLPRGTTFGERTTFAGREKQTFADILQSIQVKTSADQVLRTYGLTWTPGPLGLAPQLTTVQLYGRDGSVLTRTTTPAANASTRFSYVDDEPLRFATEESASLRNSDQPTPRGFFREPKCTQHDFVDMNADGRPDLVNAGNWSSTNKRWRVFLNRGRDGQFMGLFDTTPIQWDAPGKCIVATPTPDNEDDFAYTHEAVIDMDGDGYPDYVHVENNRVVVNLNNRVNAFTTPPVQWTNQRSAGWVLRRYVARSTEGVGGSTQIDVVDLNGDGRPDLVDTTEWTSNGNKWRVWYGGPNGWRDGDTLVSTPLEFVQFSNPADLICDDGVCRAPPITRTFSRGSLLDMNGDGIPDIVRVVERANGGWRWNVFYGKGRSFQTPPDHWDDVPQSGVLRYWQTIECTPTDRCDAMTQDVVDLNGDGLVDWLSSANYAQNDQTWRVRFNTGRGFGPAVFVPAPGHIRRGTYPRSFQSGGDTVSGAMAVDLFDVDGDKLPDAVRVPDIDSNLASIYFQSSAPEERTGLLRRIDSAIGGSTTFTYAFSPHAVADNTDPSLGIPAGELPAARNPGLPFPMWLVDQVIRHPEIGGSQPVVQSYQYDGPYFDIARREFAGFARVIRTDRQGTQRVSHYHLSTALRGRMRQQVMANSLGKALRTTTNLWQCQTGAGSYGGCASDETRQLPVLRSVTVTDSSSSSDESWTDISPRKASTSSFLYDLCGNVVSETRGGDDTTALTRTAGFSGCSANTRVCAAGFCDRPDFDQIGSAKPRTEYTYYANGLVQLVKRKGGGAGGDLVTTSVYDDYGNLTSRQDAGSNSTSFEYDAAKLRALKETNALGHATTMEYHPLWGLKTRSDDPNGASTRYDYDVFGRLSLIAEPGQTVAAPTRRFEYVLLDHGYRYDRRELETNRTADGGYLRTSTFFDGLGRRLQAQAVTEVGGAEVVVVREGVEYDDMGRSYRQYAPVVVPGGNPATRLVFGAAQAATFVFFDEFSRPVYRIAPDLATKSTSYRTAWAERTCDPNHNDDIAGSGGACTAVTRDGLGREVKRQTFLGPATTAYSTLETFYDTAGRVAGTLQNGVEATRTTTTYDDFGRKKTFLDPDSRVGGAAGTWTYAYDGNDNLVFEDDPKTGQHVDYTYDALDRLTQRIQRAGEVAGAGAASHTATYQYDGPSVTNGKGRAWKLIDSQSGTVEITSYDLRGNVQTRKRFVTLDSISTPTHVSTMQYDALGRLAAITLPYPDADEKELVFYSYSGQGFARQVLSEYGAYVRDVQHDVFGRTSRIQYGNWAEDTYTYGNASQRFRLQQIRTQRAGVFDPDRWLQYLDYDANGNVRLIRDVMRQGPRPASLTQVGVYDQLSRLDRAYQCGGQRYDSDFEYSPAGNITAKDGGAYVAGPGPHQVASFKGDAIAHDENGRITTLRDGRTLTFDREGRLMAVRRNQQALMRYDYDPSGMRVVAEKAGRGEVYFFDDFDVDTQTNQTIRHIRLGDRIIASSPVPGGLSLLASADSARVTYLASVWLGGGTSALLILAVVLPGTRRRARRAVAASTIAMLLFGQAPVAYGQGCPTPSTGTPPAGTIFYHLDHLGTVQMVSDAAATTARYLVHRPYGEKRGPYDATGMALDDGVISFGFTGQRLVDASGLIYFAARYFDTDLGMFVAHDPARQYFNPYAYGPWNPTTGKDPTGAQYEEGVDESADYTPMEEPTYSEAPGPEASSTEFDDIFTQGVTWAPAPPPDDPGDGASYLEQGAQGSAYFMGEEAARAGDLRQQYQAAASALPKTQGVVNPERTALTAAFKEKQAPPYRYLSNVTRKEALGPLPGTGATSSSSNRLWNLGGKAGSYGGRIVMGASLLNDVGRVSAAADPYRETAVVGFGNAGSFVGGSALTVGGAAVGAPLGPGGIVAFSAAGGITGSAGGRVLGEWVGGAAYDGVQYMMGR
ncbi:MAG TPA: toxin TcdB middle/N-terminal domain-containing protein [Candidatus Binatia bacterium]|jgi:RHS repeat-associated protein|nr:toxin TcdB middle/N-terminal domain-containing protein [Candidatus Binatia bacterium]